MEWTHLLLLAATVAKLLGELDRADKEVAECEGLLAASRGPERGGRISEPASNESDRARLDAAKSRQQGLRLQSEEAIEEYLASRDRIMKRRRCVVTEGISTDEYGFTPSRQVMIVAGGCDASVEAKISDYAGMFAKAFSGFQGTIVSGGTTAGISGLVGDLRFPQGRVHRVAYLQTSLPESDARHSGYDRIRSVKGEAYSPLGPVQTWVDILAAGIHPKDVRVLGVNGGRLSAFEYRLALALGATVGVVSGSGREADAILHDPYWGNHPQLLPLPPDAMTWRHFLTIPRPNPVVPENLRERMAREIHEKYLRAKQVPTKPSEPALQPWDALREDFRLSNLAVVDGFQAKLTYAGLGFRPRRAESREPYRLSPEQIALMAEEEHGRWNVERLAAGWRYGPSDKDRKISPYLLSWREIPPDIQQYDVDIVKDIPRRLFEAGFEIYELDGHEAV